MKSGNFFSENLDEFSIEKTIIESDYVPSEEEPFMNPRHLAYFKKRLFDWREEMLSKRGNALNNLQKQSDKEADVYDRASSESNRAIELRTSDRHRKLLSKIDSALKRIEDGSYGYCLETGEKISLKRLHARPIATLSIDAQEKHERLEKTFRDD